MLNTNMWYFNIQKLGFIPLGIIQTWKLNTRHSIVSEMYRPGKVLPRVAADCTKNFNFMSHNSPASSTQCKSLSVPQAANRCAKKPAEQLLKMMQSSRWLKQNCFKTLHPFQLVSPTDAGGRPRVMKMTNCKLDLCPSWLLKASWQKPGLLLARIITQGSKSAREPQNYGCSDLTQLKQTNHNLHIEHLGRCHKLSQGLLSASH